MILNRRELMQATAIVASSAAWAPRALATSTTLPVSYAEIEKRTFQWFWDTVNRENGLVPDRWPTPSFCSIAAVGFALPAYAIGAERGWCPRAEARDLTLTTLRFFWNAPQGPDATGTAGYKGFFYHFLDIETGRRVWQCELSTIDSAFLLAGALTVGTYFDRDTPVETEIRTLADALYRRADWNWARDGGATLTHGWTPENGFIPHRYEGYDEGLLLYILGLGSPTHPLPPESYRAYCATYEWRKIYDRELLYSGPLFTHQLSHMWIDFHGIRDEFMRARGSDYFQNSRQATFVQQEYAIRNPMNFAGYGEHCWGFTACDGPGWTKQMVHGTEREFFDYVARGAPFGPDDGTVAPWVVVASLPFAPEIAIPTMQHFADMDLGMTAKYGFKPSFNQSFSVPDTRPCWWVTPYHFGIDQGPVVLMVENYRTGLLWRIMRRCPAIVTGLRRAGFTGGWL